MLMPLAMPTLFQALLAVAVPFVTGGAAASAAPIVERPDLRFWLDGPLQISAMEQARFVARLAQGKLPLSERSQRIVRDILRVEEKGGAALFAKTGWASGPTPPMIGWWVGWVEREGRVYAFALNIDMASADEAAKRMVIGRSLLARLGVLATP